MPGTIRRGMQKSPQDKVGKDSRMKGVIDVTRSGKGFFLDHEGDIMIPRERLGGALSGDVVEIVISEGQLAYRGKNRPPAGRQGRVVNVVERKKNSFVGELIKTPKGMMLRADDPRVYMDFLITGAPGAPAGHKVVVDVEEWATNPVEAKVRSVIGPAGAHETEKRAI